MSFGSGPYGSAPFGGGSSYFQVESAAAVNPFTVVVVFSDPPDFDNPATVNPSNYYFGVSGLTALRVVANSLDPNSVRVITTKQEYKLYSVTVSDLVTMAGSDAIVDPLANSAGFTGFAEAGFLARVQSATAINLLFPQPMLAGPDLSDPLNYTLQTLNGTPLSVISASPNSLTNPTSVVLKVSALSSATPYALSISSNVKTLDGRDVLPNTTILTWMARPDRKTSVALSGFTGEVRATKDNLRSTQEVLTLKENFSAILGPFDFNQGARSTIEGSFTEALSLAESLEVLPEITKGLDPAIANLFGNPQGLVFFSPSLKTGVAPLSAIQVDSVESCTQAYDSYTFPKTIDPIPFYTHGAGLVATPNVTTLNNNVLFVGFYRLNEAKHQLHDRPRDRSVPPVDIGATIVLKQVYPPTRVAILNSPGWKLFDNSAPPPYPFITADNLSPFPPPTVAPTRHFVNPVEELTLSENLQALAATTVPLSETLGQLENFDLTPGENVVLVNTTETLTLAEALTAQLEIRFAETLTLTEGISIL